LKDNSIDLKFAIIADLTGQLEGTCKLKVRMQLKLAVKQKIKCNFEKDKRKHHQQGVGNTGKSGTEATAHCLAEVHKLDAERIAEVPKRLAEI
jgi:hypothetical protein